MIRKWIKRAGERIEDRLRRVCGAISPDMRVYAIVTLFVLFAALSLYSTVSAIYSLGRSDGERIRIEHLQRLAPQPEQRHMPESFGNSDAKPQQEAAFPTETKRTQSGADSPERLNTTDNERERETRQ